MGEVKKIIRTGLVYILITILIYSATIILLSKVSIGGIPLIYRTSDIYSWKGGNSYQKFKDFDKEKKYDIIVVGSSHAYRSYDPRNFEKDKINIFTLGTSAQSPLNSYYITKNYITSENCKLVILDIYDGSFTNDGFESSSDLIQNISSDKVAFDIATSYTNPLVIDLIALRFINKNNPPIYRDPSYISNGYSQKDDTLKYLLPFDEYENKLLPNSTQINYFEKTLKYLKALNIPVLMVTSPFPREKSRKQHEGYFQIFNDLAKKYNFMYLDYSFNHNLNSLKHFYDSHHLNQEGANIFDEILLKNLRRLNYFNTEKNK